MNIYRTACDVQDASNLSGVLLSFSPLVRAILDQEKVPEGQDRNFWLRKHPAFVMYLDKILSLARVKGDDGYTLSTSVEDFGKAYDACLVRAEEQFNALVVTVPLHRKVVVQ